MKKEEMRKLLEEQTLLSEREVANIIEAGVWTNDIDGFISECDANGFFDDSEADKESMREDYESGSWDSTWGVSTDSFLVGGWIVSR